MGPLLGTVVFNSVKLIDLPTIMQIERKGFSSQEAASIQAMAERISLIPDTFLGAYLSGKLVGYIVGPAISQRYLSDDLFNHVIKNPAAALAPYQSVLSLAVDPAFRGQKIGSQLLKVLAQQAKIQQRQGIILTCLPQLVPFYQRNHYVDEGLSASQHAGEQWHNMFLPLK